MLDSFYHMHKINLKNLIVILDVIKLVSNTLFICNPLVVYRFYCMVLFHYHTAIRKEL